MLLLAVCVVHALRVSAAPLPLPLPAPSLSLERPRKKSGKRTRCGVLPVTGLGQSNTTSCTEQSHVQADTFCDTHSITLHGELECVLSMCVLHVGVCCALSAGWSQCRECAVTEYECACPQEGQETTGETGAHQPEAAQRGHTSIPLELAVAVAAAHPHAVVALVSFSFCEVVSLSPWRRAFLSPRPG